MEKTGTGVLEKKNDVDKSQDNTVVKQSSKPKSSLKADDSRKARHCDKHCYKAKKSRSCTKCRSRNKKQSKKADVSTESDSSDSSSSSSSSSDDSSEKDSDSDSDTDDAVTRKKKKQKEAKSKKRSKGKHRRHQATIESSTSDSSSENSGDESSEVETEKKSSKAKTKAKKAKVKAKVKAEANINAKDSTEADTTAKAAAAKDSEESAKELRLQALEAQVARLGLLAGKTETPAAKRRSRKSGSGEAAKDGSDEEEAPAKKKSAKGKRASKAAFKRIDQLWDSDIHDYKITETADDPTSDEWDQYIFTVRRSFDWEHKYEATSVDIRSAPLRDALQHVMKDVKGISFVQHTAKVDPKKLFLYLEETRHYMKQLKAVSKKERKKKVRAAAATKSKHLKVLIKYLDKDFAETKDSLYPLLENDTITFDFLWALFKPNTVVYTSTHGDDEQPRAFKLESAWKVCTTTDGTWYHVEGRYLEYDGKRFGMGKMHASVPLFTDSRKISSLECYPIKYHRKAEELKVKLIERGKKFVALKGMNYRVHQGMAYMKRKKQVLRFNINGRVMIDPKTHRRINPNYGVSRVKPMEDEQHSRPPDEDDCSCDESSDSENGNLRDHHAISSDDDKPKRKIKVVEDENGDHRIVLVRVEDNENESNAEESLEQRTDDVFTDEELLIASPVVLGFAFSEKLWLEITISGLSEVQWNEGAYDSLVIPDQHKSIVKSLVTSHKFSASKNIDDVISGKGKGLVAVLHGPPGTGKTLTAEGIAELLKCPLYMVSTGELGTDPRVLERNLTDILDIAHAWGAILLLDEADVFLEQRSIQDIHRNALVSIFLRLLEYFQGILFLTTNRVETFDDAFQSRIHVALKYGELTPKARRSVWKMFIERVRKVEGVGVAPFSDADFDTLAKHKLNGRQIKNSTRAAQALALSEKLPLSMVHLSKVLQVAQSFEQDLKGGTGYEDAMRSYT